MLTERTRHRKVLLMICRERFAGLSKTLIRASPKPKMWYSFSTDLQRLVGAMSVYFFRSEPGAAELRRLARRESGRVCQRVLMIANMLDGMDHEEAARLAGLSRSVAYEWHNR